MSRRVGVREGRLNMEEEEEEHNDLLKDFLSCL